MNPAIKTAMKTELWAKIKRVGEIYDEDPQFIKEYAKEVYERNLGDLTDSLECFRDLVIQGELIYPEKKKRKIK